ncbi:MAG: HEAT repeat domain-containing protein [Actinomycetota bacterium]|nr:HEAT repeat domain-containing protein [Actinomycetota bacterium]
MDARGIASERGLVPAAVRHLTTDALAQVPLEALGPTKALLKRFFSAQPWGPDDEQALAEMVGPGEGWWRHPLDDDLVLEFGWSDGRFELHVRAAQEAKSSSASTTDPWAGSLDGPVTPEATPNPRTVMFRTGPIHEGQSRPHRAGENVDDARVAALFEGFDDISDVLVATDFVAVSLIKPNRWQDLLGPVLDVVTEQFVSVGSKAEGVRLPEGTIDDTAQRVHPRDRQETRLERAWRELGHLRPGSRSDLERIRAAARHEDPARRQVAANLLREADSATARAEWARLLDDGSRLVRRATVDAMVDVGREELRSLLEGALGDEDPWVRWKAVRGLSELGASTSQEAIEALLADRDFRVRQEAALALRG